MDFSKRYGDRMHRDVRTGPTHQTLPGLVEVEDMISKSRVQLESLTKIREVVVAQQAAYAQQAADQRQHKAFDPPTPILDDQDVDEVGTGFAGADPKRIKRTGRAAPPGRCHSCNRAETPEWRRGPDGARTLCNACGLHYAKLTRKQQGSARALLLEAPICDQRKLRLPLPSTNLHVHTRGPTRMFRQHNRCLSALHLHRDTQNASQPYKRLIRFVRDDEWRRFQTL